MSTEIAIAGASGYIGSRLCARLLRDRRLFATFRARPGAPEPPEADRCIFLSWPRASLFWGASALGADDVATELGRRLVLCTERYRHTLFVSSGQATTPRTLYPDHRSTAMGPYGVSKALAERYLRDHADPAKYGIVRLGTVFGPSPAPRWDLVINSMLLAAAQTGEFVCKGYHLERAHARIDTVVDALVGEPPVGPEPVLVYDFAASMGDLASMVRRITGARMLKLTGDENSVSYGEELPLRLGGRWDIVDYCREWFSTINSLLGHIQEKEMA